VSCCVLWARAAVVATALAKMRAATIAAPAPDRRAGAGFLTT